MLSLLLAVDGVSAMCMVLSMLHYMLLGPDIRAVAFRRKYSYSGMYALEITDHCRVAAGLWA